MDINIAESLAAARRDGRSLLEFPGEPPVDVGTAYALQEKVSLLLGEETAGWKVGMIQPHLRGHFGHDRFLGPVHKNRIRQAGDETMTFEMIPGGSAAFEAEFIFQVARDIERDESIARDALPQLLSGARIGIEILTSCVRNVADFGSGAIIADLGFNGGLALGEPVPDLEELLHAQAHVLVTQDDETEIAGSTGAVLGGLAAALEFAIRTAAATPRGLRKGDWISSGALAGLHSCNRTSHLRADFGRHGVVSALLKLPAAGGEGAHTRQEAGQE